MMIRYETEAMIRETIAERLKAQRLAKKQTFDPAELSSPMYQQWIQDRIDDARRNRRLVTENQFADLRAGRSLQVGDAVRYIGPTIAETSRVTGRHVIRPHGQVGTITSVQRGGGGQIQHTFMPKVSAQTMALAEHQDVEVLQLITHNPLLFERLES